MTHFKPNDDGHHDGQGPSPADKKFKEIDIEEQNVGEIDNEPDPPVNPGGCTTVPSPIDDACV